MNRPSDFLLTLRMIAAAAERGSVYREIDEDLQREAGMNGWLQRMLQAARDLDAADAPRSAAYEIGYLAATHDRPAAPHGLAPLDAADYTLGYQHGLDLVRYKVQP